MKGVTSTGRQTTPKLPRPSKRNDDAHSRSYTTSSSKRSSSSPSWTSQPKLLQLGLGLTDEYEFNLRTTSYSVRGVLSDDNISLTTATVCNFDRDQEQLKFAPDQNHKYDDEHSLNNGVVASRVEGAYARGGVETVLTKKKRRSTTLTTLPKVDLNPCPPPESPTSAIHYLHRHQQHVPQQCEPVSRVIARVDTIAIDADEVPLERAETIVDEEMYDISSSIERSMNDTDTSIEGVDLRHFGMIMNKSEPLSNSWDLEIGNNRCTQINTGGFDSSKVDQHLNPSSLMSGHVITLTKKLGDKVAEDDSIVIATIDSASKVSTIANNLENDTNETRRKSWLKRNRLLLFELLSYGDRRRCCRVLSLQKV